ncbi:ParB/RepB/Spo0J family partition protein [Marinobacter goseongensis]|uniref:ParB/RepB/Spo0J family partition protein n=1 Tax=Marinobacter goseongensis TaxID=453838 RepID=UPI002005B497|nr:ParB N-terminal domain-containing protein [Marinobacter goseongensis]MCK7553300.1 ParB N-terminal domain-containing protein [Marinobacter goseongensis]
MAEKTRRPPKGKGFSAGKEEVQRSVSQEGQKRTFTAATAPAQPRPEDLTVSREITPGDEFRLIPARLIRRWDLKDRTEAEMLDDPEYAELIEQVGQEGIVSPVTVRPLDEPDDQGHLFEGIVGYKRASAAKYHDLDVPAVVKRMTELEALRYQRSENYGRSNVSVWGYGLHYVDIVKSGRVQGSNSEIASAIGIDRTQFATYYRIANTMPKDIAESVKLHRLGYNSLYKIIQLVDIDDRKKRDEIIDRIVEHADEIDRKPEKAKLILDRIESLYKGESGVRPSSNGVGVFRSQKGKTFTVKPGKGKVTVTMLQGALDVASQDEITKVINDFLEEKGLTIEKVEPKP